MTMKQEQKNLFKLNTRYNKTYCQLMYFIFCDKDKNGTLFYDPLYQTKMKIVKADTFLKIWRQFFYDLYPVLTKNTKMSVIEKINIIHLIFGNTTKHVEKSWFLLPHTAIDVGFDFLLKSLNEHKDYIKKKKKYDITFE